MSQLKTADILFDIQTRDCAIEDKLVADLGCGAGMLTIGAHLLGARLVVGFDIDADAVKDLTQNISENFAPDAQTIEVVLCDVTKLAAREKTFDTVITNPPFGTTDQTNGMDTAFLEKALLISRENVYSLHKTTTRKVSEPVSAFVQTSGCSVYGSYVSY
uniref:Methyltransferase-like protein 5 n=1 Tax=Schistocephalus solidus TaxID=70667 RepID=A0A0V0J3H4_SCHSO